MIKVVEINAETNEIIEREPNANEIKDFEQNKKNYDARISAIAQTEIEKQAILDRLGLTAEEAQLLLGSN